MLPMRRILHPTDFSEHSHFAFQLACALARDHSGEIVVMHVVVPPLLVYGEGMLPPLPVAGELKEKLQRVQPQDEDVAVSHLLEEGDPADQILRVAQEGGYDLVVMGTHGRTGLGRLLMGSVAEKVMRKAPCPVLVAKAPQPRKFAKRAAAAPASR